MHQGTNVAEALEVQQVGAEEFPAAHHRLLSLSVTGGFLDGLQLNFSDGLNCIIGGRGTGKTTVLEFIRYLLSSDDPSERSKANKEVVEENLKSGKVVLDIETQSGVPYRIERSLGEAAALFTAKGDPITASLDRSRLFKADIYGQNKIEEIARNSKFQLQLIDRFAEAAVRHAQEEIERVKVSLRQKINENEQNEEALRECEHAVSARAVPKDIAARRHPVRKDFFMRVSPGWHRRL